MSEVRNMNGMKELKTRATRRGISNIIAVLILIFIVIVFSSIIYIIVTNYAVRLSTNAGVEITNAQITSLPNGQSTLTLSVANTGTVAEAINVSVNSIKTQTFSGLTAYAYFSFVPNGLGLLTYPYTGTIPSYYFANITGWSPPYSYGTPYYQGKTYLGMVTQPFPSSVNLLNTQGPSSTGYIATGSFTVSQTTTYRFQIVTDDGTAIWINGPSTNGQWIDVFGGSAWQPQGPIPYPANESLSLQPGTYQIAIEWINRGRYGLSAIKITQNLFSFPSFTSSITFNITKTYTLATNLQGGATTEQTFLLPIQFTPGQNVTIIVTASSSLGDVTTATSVVVS